MERRSKSIPICRWYCQYILIWLVVNLVAFEAMPQGGRSFTANSLPVDINTFNNEIIKMMKVVGVPGMSLAVIEDNRIVFFETYGVRKQGGDDQVTKNTVFDGCSLSKSLLAFVAYQLVDEGKLDLDKPMYEYLKHNRLEYDPRYKLITSRMVLSHSSGLENWGDMNNSDTLEIISSPGKKFVYSGEGYQYLARVVESILKQSYEAYIRERVVRPLGMKNTYLRYKRKEFRLFHESSPWNYAIGHQVFGQQQVFKNSHTLPAAGNHFTAEDYAKLILGIFNTRYVSAARRKDILQPIVKVGSSSVFYGPGFEVCFHDNDTIINHGGDKPGYKNYMVYSVVKKRGLVFMANSELGKAMASKLCAMTAALNIEPFVESLDYTYGRYPSIVFDLLNVYKSQGTDAMFLQLENERKQMRVDGDTLNILANLFWMGGQRPIAKNLLEQSIILNPNASLAHARLGLLYLTEDSYAKASEHLMKAKSLNFSLWEIEGFLRDCDKRMGEAAKRKDRYLVKVRGSEETLIRAENYNVMSGVRLEPCSDEGGGHSVAYIDSNDWMEYRVDIETGGTYSIVLRTASLPGGGQLQLMADTDVLATVDISSTKGWQKWAYTTIDVDLPAGTRTLKLYAKTGGFNVNWIKFSSSLSRKN
jgi:CubicO group peptidase (beta-lactamase class C family)